MKIYELFEDGEIKSEKTFTIEDYVKILKPNLKVPFAARDKSISIENNQINISDSIELLADALMHGDKLPYKFGTTKSFKYSQPEYFESLKSLKNFPDEVHGQLSIHARGSLTNLNHFPSKVSGIGAWGSTPVIYVEAAITSFESLSPVSTSGFARFIVPKLTSFIGIENLSFVKEDGKISVHLSKDFKGPLLSLLKVKNLKEFHIMNTKISEELKQAQEIINKYLQDSKNIWKCQDELQDANLDDFADL